MKRELSAGGVVLRTHEGRREMAVVNPRRGVTALPKGHPDGDETLEQAASREVREEAGVIADPVGKLGEVEYWYTLHGERVLKSVTFFLFEYRAGSTDDHDDEVVSAGWVSLEQGPALLSYKGEGEMASKALEWTAGEAAAGPPSK
ncbi:MAG: NUDIX hydrolase [Thermoleophilaceae bacterium]